MLIYTRSVSSALPPILHRKIQPSTQVCGKRNFSLLRYAKSHFGSSTTGDEATGIMLRTVQHLRWIGNRFWKISSYLCVSSVVILDPIRGFLRFLHLSFWTRVSSCPIERVFSAVNTSSSRERSSISSSQLEGNVLIRSNY